MKHYQHFFIVLFLCLYGLGFSQNITNKLKSSEYQFIYRLTDKQAHQLFTKKSSDVFENFDYASPVDTCTINEHYQTDSLGHFVGIYVENENLHYEYYQNKPYLI